jgi:hypothetical protein
MLYKLVTFLFAIELLVYIFTRFKYLQIMKKLYNYEKNIFKFIVLSIAFARPGTILLIVRERTPMKKV